MWPGPAFGKPEALFVTWHNIAITLIDPGPVSFSNPFQLVALLNSSSEVAFS